MATAAQMARLFLERRVSSLMVVTSSWFAVPCFRMLYQAGPVGSVAEAGGDAFLTAVPLTYGNETGYSQGGAQVGHRWLFPIAAIGYWRVGGYAMRTLRTAGC